MMGNRSSPGKAAGALANQCGIFADYCQMATQKDFRTTPSSGTAPTQNSITNITNINEMIPEYSNEKKESAVDQKRIVRRGDRVNWRTVNGRGNPCSRLATVYSTPRNGMATIYVYGLAKLRRVPLSVLRPVKANVQDQTTANPRS